MTRAEEGSGPMVPEPEPVSHTIEQPADDEPAGVEVEVSDLGAPDHNASQAHAIGAGARTRACARTSRGGLGFSSRANPGRHILVEPEHTRVVENVFWARLDEHQQISGTCLLVNRW